MNAPLSEVHEKVGTVLLKSWDPLGVAGRPASDPERAHYISEVVDPLATGASDRQIAEHLVRLETQRLGYQDTEPGMLRPTAKKIRLLYQRLSAGDRAG